MITSLAEARARYKALLIDPTSGYWRKEPKDQAHVIGHYLATLNAKPGQDSYDISSDTVFTWTD